MISLLKIAHELEEAKAMKESKSIKEAWKFCYRRLADEKTVEKVAFGSHRSGDEHLKP